MAAAEGTSFAAGNVSEVSRQEDVLPCGDVCRWAWCGWSGVWSVEEVNWPLP